jgi:hypothetical protein
VIILHNVAFSYLCYDPLLGGFAADPVQLIAGDGLMVTESLLRLCGTRTPLQPGPRPRQQIGQAHAVQHLLLLGC